MPSTYIGTGLVKAIKIGSQDVQKVYVGTTLVWSKTQMRDDFNEADRVGLDPARWASVGESSPSPYLESIVSNTCRINIPDNSFSEPRRIATARYLTAVTPADDGYVECRLASQGSTNGFVGDLFTDTFSQADLAGTYGVGIRARQSSLFIVRMVSGTRTEMMPCGSFVPGDTARLVHAGRLHSMYVNGAFRAEWRDSTLTAGQGSAYRSLLVSHTGAKGFFFGAREFSPALDYVEAA